MREVAKSMHRTGACAINHPSATCPVVLLCVLLPLSCALPAVLRAQRCKYKHTIDTLTFFLSCVHTGRNFAMIGCMFAGTECVVESLRGRTDHGASVYNNSVIAGFLVGGALGFRGKPTTLMLEMDRQS